jgi:hypothetical protein
MKNPSKLAATFLVAAGTFGLVGANPASAAPCADSSLATLLNVQCTTTEGFLFTLTAFNSFMSTDQLSFTPAGANNFQYSVQGTNGYALIGSPYTLSYTLTAPPTRELDMFTSGGSSSFPGTASTWNIAAISPQAQSANATIGFPSTVGGFDQFAPNIVTSTFTGTLNVSAGQVSTVTGLVTTTQPVIPVPGPLPLLGAGVAFGLSRKLRRRIKSAA